MLKSIFRIENLTALKPKVYNLSKINLSLAAGEIQAIVGLEGSGKKNLIQALAGLIETEGRVYLEEKQLDLKLANLRENKIDFIFYNSSLVDQLTIVENICLNRYPRLKFLPLVDKKKAFYRTRKALKLMELDFSPTTYVKTLSRDEKKQLAIARAFFYQPKVIIIYEPTNGLSIESIKKFYDNIYEYKSNGGAVIYITKQWKDALKIADKIVVLNQGSVAGIISTKAANKNPDQILNMMLGNQKNYDSKNNYSLDAEAQKILNTVFKATEFLTSNYELKDVLKLLAEYSADFTKADNCTIKLLDENTGSIIDTVRYNTGSGIESEIKKEIIFKIAREEKIFSLTVADQKFNSVFIKNRGVKSIIIIPVLIRSHISGIIQLSFSYQKLYNYSEDEKNYLTTLAKQAAIAIEDTRLMGRSTLLQESHHRIKNNLQYIISLITLQKAFIEDNSKKNIEDILNNTIARIKSIAAVHDLLSQDSFGRSIINLKDIFKVIINFLNNGQLKIKINLSDIFISYSRASAIALVFNEILSNCIEHAFIDEIGEINVITYRQDEQIKLIVADNGQGMPAEFCLEKQSTLGLSIVYSIIKKQFRGDILLTSNKGTRIEITIPD
ncbi:ATP-binding cassette domain-containing protein [Halanaerobium salsuginis]|uniref:Ribose transport system ATP-binding protein n=1 Tax=Halanaerobium salsuginis TaxID=29563 RepID=A0A1I4HG25_9FIRM|nr:ATP-binding cassette domain-containing protein [Halanaerobium salsuginis]SFL40653.1 ribose transport system ATP-binding protein [Halanaerobium salsuginis]